MSTVKEETTTLPEKLPGWVILVLVVVFSVAPQPSRADSGGESKITFLHDVSIPDGGELVSVLMKGITDANCVYIGRGYVSGVGSIHVGGNMRTCVVGDNKAHKENMNFMVIANAGVVENTATGETVHKVSEGAVAGILEVDDIADASSVILESLVLGEIYDAHARRFLGPTCEDLFFFAEDADTKVLEEFELSVREIMSSGLSFGRGFYYLALIELQKRQTEFSALGARCRNRVATTANAGEP